MPASMRSAANPLLAPWPGPHGLPPFDRIEAKHFAPALDAAMREHRAEIAAIANGRSPPTFENTIAALDAAGRAYARVGAVFHNLAASHTSPALQAVEREVMPKLAAHDTAILLDAKLFKRIDALYAKRDALGLDPEQLRLLERVHLDFTLAGAKLAPAARERAQAIAERLAELTTTFRQNVLHDEATQGLALEHERDLAGLPAWLRDAAREAARRRGAPNAWWISISRSIVAPFLEWSDRRDLRQRAFELWTRRGELDPAHDNRAVAREILALRPERAMLEAMARESGATHAIEPWDWRHYAEKVRRARYQVDDAEVKPYFALDRMLEAAFDVAGRLFGIRFVPIADATTYHPDVRAFEVRDAGGAAVGVFLSDNFMRPTKRGGAWMSTYLDQSRALGQRPIVVNNNNFAKAPAGEPTLLSADDVRTLFHEFGHGLHGLFSKVKYPYMSGTNTPRDFVEFPSQFNENWALEPSVLASYAKHYQTGAAMPADLVEKIKKASTFNEGFATLEATSAALLDLEWHALPATAKLQDPEKFEAAALKKYKVNFAPVPPRYHTTYFSHVWGGGYAAGYYAYLWTAVLGADAYQWFVENGGMTAANGKKFRDAILSRGGTVDAHKLYLDFRGKEPSPAGLIKKRGL
jgi:peptidyl-dipeptidase Dcp